MTAPLAIDLFEGAGNAALGIAAAGYHVVGVEWNADACRTARAAGHHVIRADLSTYPWPTTLRGQVALLHGSPPCQPFSSAGDGLGEDDARDGMPWMLRAIAELKPPIVSIENVPGLTAHRDYFGQFLHDFRALGYDVDWRILNAADFGVPQTRKRLIILGRNDGATPRWPAITHVRGGSLFLKPWVSMADALGWPRTWQLDPVRGAGIVARHGTRPSRAATDPAPTVTTNVSRYRLNTRRDQRAPGVYQTRELTEPAPAVATVCGQWQWENGRARELVTLDELAALQAFPPSYPFHGNRSAVARQIGNALPAPLIEAVIRANTKDVTA